MFTYSQYAYLRYVLLINIIVSLVPAMTVKGRANDPLLHATWWTFDQHSAVMVVGAAAILGTLLAFILSRMKVQKRMAFVGCGVFVGDFPAIFYYLLAPSDGIGSSMLADMCITGTLCGLVGGFLLASMLRKKVRHDAPV